MVTTTRITPCVWFADEAEEAAKFYTGSFSNSRITAITDEQLLGLTHYLIHRSRGG